MKIHHINIVVSNLDAAVQFFSFFGFSVKRARTIGGEWLDLLIGKSGVKADYRALGHPDTPISLELLHFLQPAGTGKKDDSNPMELGYRHIALVEEDIESKMREMKEAGIEFTSELQKNSYGRRMCYCKGPDGILVELLEKYGE